MSQDRPTDDGEPLSDARLEQQRQRAWIAVLRIAVIAGAIVVGVYGLATAGQLNFVAARLIAGGLMLGGASLLLGGLMGFLFGIPRSLQESNPSPAPPPPAAGAASGGSQEPTPSQARQRSRPNTNLEQVSDWLSKILVGVGLTELSNLPRHIGEAANFFAPALSALPHGKPFAAAEMIFFAVAGFLWAFLWTRLYLGRAMDLADSDEVRKQLDEREAIDARALTLTRQQLEPQQGAPPVDQARLHEAIKRASPTAKVEAYYLAANHRKKTWERDKPAMERVIPIFEALCDSDPGHRFHKNFGQLGFAVKDKEPPDYARAEKLLTEAIRIRGPWKTAGWVMYEFNRAWCRIKLDALFAAGKASAPTLRKAIVEDLAALVGTDLEHLPKEELVATWRALNGLTDDELKAEAAKVK